jgi:hypothetical protein
MLADCPVYVARHRGISRSAAYRFVRQLKENYEEAFDFSGCGHHDICHTGLFGHKPCAQARGPRYLNTDTHAQTDIYTYIDGHVDPHAIGYAHPHPHTDEYSDPYPYTNAYQHADSNKYAHADACAIQHAYNCANRCPHIDPHLPAQTHFETDQYAHSQAYQHTTATF